MVRLKKSKIDIIDIYIYLCKKLNVFFITAIILKDLNSIKMFFFT